jgi:hypothetical protein
MYPHVVQFETRRSQIAGELRLIREREAARERVATSEVGSVALEANRRRVPLSGGRWSPLRRKARIATDSA